MLNLFIPSRFLRFMPVLLLLLLCSCSKDAPEDNPKEDNTIAPAPEKNKTVLFYMMDDHNLWAALEKTINELEMGWDESLDGNMLVYLDPSEKLTQFP